MALSNWLLLMVHGMKKFHGSLHFWGMGWMRVETLCPNWYLHSLYAFSCVCTIDYSPHFLNPRGTTHKHPHSLQDVERRSWETGVGIVPHCWQWRGHPIPGRSHLNKDGNKWKERVAETIKFLKLKVIGRVRLLMRQSKTLKIFPNLFILPTMNVKEHVGIEKYWIWQARDFADGELKEEPFLQSFSFHWILQKLYWKNPRICWIPKGRGRRHEGICNRGSCLEF